MLNLFEPREAADKPVRATLKWKIFPTGSNRSISEGLIAVPAFVNPTRPAPVSLELRVPRDEGAYNLRLSVTGRGFSASSGSCSLSWSIRQAAMDHRPRAKTWLIPLSLRQRPVSQGEPQFIAAAPDSSLSRLLKLKSARDDPDADATSEMNPLQVAYKLRVSHPGHAHRLELSLPREQNSGCRSGSCRPTSKASSFRPGLTVRFRSRRAGRERAARPGCFERRACPPQIFWPRDREPLLVVASRRPGTAANISRVVLYDLGETLSAEARGTTASPRGLPAGSRRFTHDWSDVTCTNPVWPRTLALRDRLTMPNTARSTTGRRFCWQAGD